MGLEMVILVTLLIIGSCLAFICYKVLKAGGRAFMNLVQISLILMITLIYGVYKFSDYYYYGPAFPFLLIPAVILTLAGIYDTCTWLFCSPCMKDEVLLLKYPPGPFVLVVNLGILIFFTVLINYLIHNELGYYALWDIFLSNIFLSISLLMLLPTTRHVFDYCYYKNCLKKGMIDQ